LNDPAGELVEQHLPKHHAYLVWVLADGCEWWIGEYGGGHIVKADDGQIAPGLEAAVARRA
jgi:hypothetical protein